MKWGSWWYGCLVLQRGPWNASILIGTATIYSIVLYKWLLIIQIILVQYMLSLINIILRSCWWWFLQVIWSVCTESTTYWQHTSKQREREMNGEREWTERDVFHVVMSEAWVTLMWEHVWLKITHNYVNHITEPQRFSFRHITLNCTICVRHVPQLFLSECLIQLYTYTVKECS